MLLGPNLTDQKCAMDGARRDSSCSRRPCRLAPARIGRQRVEHNPGPHAPDPRDQIIDVLRQRESGRTATPCANGLTHRLVSFVEQQAQARVALAGLLTYPRVPLCAPLRTDRGRHHRRNLTAARPSDPPEPESDALEVLRRYVPRAPRPQPLFGFWPGLQRAPPSADRGPWTPRRLVRSHQRVELREHGARLGYPPRRTLTLGTLVKLGDTLGPRVAFHQYPQRRYGVL